MRADYAGEFFDGFQNGGKNFSVHGDEADGVCARLAASQHEIRDVDLGFAQQRAQTSDKARLVLVADEQHMGG